MYIGVNVCELLRQWISAPIVTLDVIYFKYVNFNATEDGRDDLYIFQNFRKLDRDEVAEELHWYILRVYKSNISNRITELMVDDLCSFLQFNTRYQVIAQYGKGGSTSQVVCYLDKDCGFDNNIHAIHRFLAKKDCAMELTFSQIVGRELKRCIVR